MVAGKVRRERSGFLHSDAQGETVSIFGRNEASVLHEPSWLVLDEGGLRNQDVGGAAAFEGGCWELATLRWREVGVFEVLRQHAMGVEEAAVDGDAVLLHTRPGMGVGVHGGDGMHELVV